MHGHESYNISSELRNLNFDTSLVARDGRIIRAHSPLLVTSGVSWSKCLVDQPPPCCGDTFVILPDSDFFSLKTFVDNLYSDVTVTSSSIEDEPKFQGYSNSDIPPPRPVPSSIKRIEREINDMYIDQYNRSDVVISPPASPPGPAPPPQEKSPGVWSWPGPGPGPT